VPLQLLGGTCRKSRRKATGLLREDGSHKHAGQHDHARRRSLHHVRCIHRNRRSHILVLNVVCAGTTERTTRRSSTLLFVKSGSEGGLCFWQVISPTLKSAVFTATTHTAFYRYLTFHLTAASASSPTVCVISWRAAGEAT
jgi:hypothetical protein